MSRIYKNAGELIGNTPLYEVSNIEKLHGLKARVLVKLEYFNLTGSIKDRIAKRMIEDAEKAGKLKKGGVIIEHWNWTSINWHKQGLQSYYCYA